MSVANTLSIPNDTTSLFTTHYPNPGSETIILLHGGPGVPMGFESIARHLARRYDVIVFEQRGTGRSPAPGAAYTVAEYLSDLEAVARHFGLERFHLLGHSWGGLYAQLYAERYPERLLSLLLLSPSSGTGDLWKQTEREVMAFNRQAAGFWGFTLMGLRSVLGMLGNDRAYQKLFLQVLANYRRWRDPAFVADPALVEQVRAEPINKTRPHLVAHAPLTVQADPPFPVRLLYGEHDIYGPSREAVRGRFPTSALDMVAGAGHLSWEDNPTGFFQLLDPFYRLSTSD